MIKQARSKNVSRTTTSDKNDSVLGGKTVQSLRAQIIQLWDDGYTPAEIASHNKIPECIVRDCIAAEISEVA